MIKVFRPPVADVPELRKFGWVMAAAAALLFGVAGPLLRHHPARLWPWIVAGVFAAAALIVPRWLAPVRSAWLTFGYYLGYVNTRIILGIVFFVVITPAGVILRLTGRDPLERKIEKGRASYKIDREGTLSSMERPF